MTDINTLRGITPPPREALSKEDEKKEKIVERGLERSKPNLPGPEKEIAKKQLMERVNGKIGSNKELTASDLELDTLAFSVAESLQTIESETCPVNEYFRWIDDAEDVIKDMTDGDITRSDIDNRESFLLNMDQRESEMRVYMALYASCNSPTAKERLAFLQIKLAKLMELRSAVKVSTKNKEEAEYSLKVKEEEKKIAAEYIATLEYRRMNPDDKSLFTEQEYRAGLMMAQALIALSQAQELSEAERLQKQRYEEYLNQRMEDLQKQRDFSLKTKDVNLYSMDNMKNIQMNMASHQEMMNLVKIASTTARHGYESEEEKTRREVCCAVLEYRRRGKEVPDRILYKLGAKSFVPDYSISEELLNRGMQGHSKEDAIKRINELTGRQSIVNKPKSEVTMQRFDSQRFIALQQTRGREMLYNN